MNSMLFTSLSVSVLAMGVIFVVLSLLIVTINILVKLIPYQAPPAPPVKKQAPAPASEEDEHVAVIAAVLAAHLGKSPDQFRIVNISSR